MLFSALPTKFNIPFANSAGAGFTRPIPQASQIGIQAGAASLTDGFPPVCFLPIGAGGTPPWGADFNGILNQATAWVRWLSAGGPVPYDGTFQSAISGYPIGALIQSAVTIGLFWYNTTDGNTSNPDTGGSGWSPIALGSGGTLTTGDMKWRPTAEVLPGWVKSNATTIGNAASNATQLADPTAAALFSWHWTNFSNTQCPVFTSAGTPTTRGASAAADFAANKAIQVLDQRGMSQIGMDTMGGAPTTRLSGVPVTSGAATSPGSVLGENLHALITAELAAHAHNYVDPTHNHGHVDPTHTHSTNTSGQTPVMTGSGISLQPGGTAFSLTGVSIVAAATGLTNVANSIGITISNTGSGTAHNTVSLSMTGTWYIKL